MADNEKSLRSQPPPHQSLSMIDPLLAKIGNPISLLDEIKVEVILRSSEDLTINEDIFLEQN